jgi:hypothetical protein
MEWLQSKLLLKKKQCPAGEMVDNVTVELEVNSVVVNRVSKKEEELCFLINSFYSQYGRRGKVFIIRQSKMNFTSLLNEDA